MHDEVDGAAGLVVAGPRVDADAVATLLHSHPHVVRATRHPVAVHRVLALVGAVGDACAQGLPDRFATLLREERPGLPHGSRPEAGEQFLDAALAEPATRQHRADVAAQDIGEARVAEEDAEGLVVEPSLAIDADGGDDDALVEDLGSVGRDAAGAQAADVPEVPPRLGKGHQLTVVEHRGREHHVGGVRHAAP
jgi:hypothetical protein